MRFLRTNTAIRLTVGPFFDKTDGVTPETAITVTSCKLTLMVDDANVPTLVLDTAPTASGGANDMVHVTGDDAGFYDLELAAANVNYVGRAMLAITDAATHCPVFHEFMILPAMVYDSLILGTDDLDTNTKKWNDLTTVALPLVPATAGRTLVVDAAGLADANMVKVGPTGSGTAQTAGDLKSLIDAVDNFVDTEISDVQSRLPAALGANGNLKADVRDWIGTAVATPTVNGVPEVDMTHVQGDSYQASGLASVGQDYADNSRLSANVTLWNGDSAAVTGLEESMTYTWQWGPRMVRTTIASLTNQTTFRLTAGSNNNNAYRNKTILISNNDRSNFQMASARILSYDGSTKEIVLAADPGLFTMGAGEIVEILAIDAMAVTDGTGLLNWNAAWDSEVQSEVDDALVAQNLDHLFAVAITTGDVIDNSFAAKITSKSATASYASYVNTTDALEASADKHTSTQTLVVAANDDIDVTNARLGAFVGTGDNTILGWMRAIMRDDITTPSDIGGGYAASTQSLEAAQATWFTNILAAIDTVDNLLDTELPALTTAVDALPTNAELATALGTADDAVLAAIAALNNLGTADIRTAIGMVSANLDTQLGDLPTNAELATALGTSDDAVLAALVTLAAAVDAVDNLLDTEMPALTASIAALFTTARPQSYRTDGSTGTIDQLLYELIGHHGESAIASTTKTIYQIDGTTPAMTFTLNSSTTPTAVTRAT